MNSNPNVETVTAKQRVLFVDDDPIAVRIYQKGLTSLGYEVDTAVDGLAALQCLRARKPDVLVLDLMMPRFSGVEVIKFMRQQKDLAHLPVIVLSNAYMDPMAQDAAALGAQKGLLKIKCNPALLGAAIREVLQGETPNHGIDNLLAAPAIVSPKPEPQAVSATRSTQSPPSSEGLRAEAGPIEQARQELLGNGQTMASDLRQLWDRFQSARTNQERELQLQDVYRKVHFMTAMAGIAEHHAIAQLASAFEAMLFSMTDKLPEVEPSQQRTAALAIDFLGQLLAQPPNQHAGHSAHPLVLTVDDDRLCNHLVISALRNAQLQARGTESPQLALQWLQEQHYDLVLLDIEMPGLDGFEVCKRLRRIPGYEKTPVIYVTLHSDFETRAKSSLSGADDLIAKPIIATELAVKAVMHLLKSRLKR